MLSGSFMDYAAAARRSTCPLDITLNGVPTAANPLGVKGSGQAGAIAAPAERSSAPCSTHWRRCGVTHIDMPATPERVWRAIQEART